MFNTIKHLVFRSNIWALVIDRVYRKIFEGLANYFESLRSWLDLIWLDMFPESTRELLRWESLFDLPETGLSDYYQRQRLAGAWQQTGGSHPDYLTDVLHGAGFPQLFVYDFWCGIDSSGDPIVRDPNAYVAVGAYVLPYITSADPNDPLPPVGTALADSDAWPFFMYVGPDPINAANPALVPAERKRELEILIEKIKPAQLWTVIYADFY